MKKTKIKQRVGKAIDAFFEEENSDDNNSISFTGDSNILRNELSAGFSEKADTFVKVLKQVFLFFPGTFVLFIISFAFSVISINNPFNASMPSGRLVSVIGWFLAASFMTWFGIGDVRKPKHLVIPLSIIVTGIVLGIISGILSAGFYQFQKFVWNDAYPLYFFPLALIVPFLAKGLIDSTDKS